ncbi:hypothetical protein VNI00_017745 [Paramarasmius palmivorus]|uniref:F-box domain-containing protein n=1 Tax=Paramarasmius palmivorus TaxID=297713 RepID=A0AAW0B4I9_9AGAR
MPLYSTSAAVNICPPELIEKIADLLLGTSFVNDQTLRLVMYPQAMKDLNRMTVFRKSWIPVVRSLQAKSLFGEPVLRSKWDRLVEVLNGEVSSSFAGQTDSFYISMWDAPDVRPIRPGFFFRSGFGPSEWKRGINPYLNFLSTTLTSGETVGEVLYSGTKQLVLVAVPHPHYLLPAEINTMTRAFRNITDLEIRVTWSVKRFVDAITFLGAFEALESVILRELYVVDDEEKAAWEVLEREMGDCRLPNLDYVVVESRFSPYNIMLLLALGPLPALKQLALHVKGKDLQWMGDKTAKWWPRVAGLLSGLTFLDLFAKESSERDWEGFDLTVASKLVELEVRSGRDIDFSSFLQRNSPWRATEILTIPDLMGFKDLAALDIVLASQPCLRVVNFEVPVAIWEDDGVIQEWANIISDAMPLCKGRDLLKPKKVKRG